MRASYSSSVLVYMCSDIENVSVQQHPKQGHRAKETKHMVTSHLDLPLVRVRCHRGLPCCCPMDSCKACQPRGKERHSSSNSALPPSSSELRAQHVSEGCTSETIRWYAQQACLRPQELRAAMGAPLAGWRFDTRMSLASSTRAQRPVFMGASRDILVLTY